MKYSSLINVQSCYNFLNSTIKPQDYVDFIKTHDLKVGFYADLNTMYGAAEFNEIAQKQQIKPVIGVAFDLTFGRIHFFAKNNQGFKLISHLSSLANSDDTPNAQEIENEIFKPENNYNDTFVIFTPSVENYYKFQEKLENKFQANLFYGISKQNSVWISKNIKNVVFANEINYFDENDYFVQKVLKAIREGNTLAETETPLKNYYLNNDQLAKYIDINLHNQNIAFIVENIAAEVINSGQNHYLTYPNANKMPSIGYMKQVCAEALAEQSEINTPEYQERLEKEITVIEQMGFVDYFLIVADMIKYAESQNILVGPGRGSAAGSLVSYLLGITKLDPIKWGLLFERFLNEERVTKPDIDIDFQDDRRDQILEYLFEKYGAEHFATITTFQTIGIKNAIRDCGRVFELESEVVNTMSKQIRDGNVKDLKKAISESDYLQTCQAKYGEIFAVMEKIIGLPRQTGTHAAGVVFADEKLSTIVPTKIGINGIYQTQFPMNYLENIGLIKTDILGLRNLSTIQEVVFAIKKFRKQDIDLLAIPLHDKNTFESLRNGDTSGIFQLESTGMTDVLKKMKVNSVDDIAITSSLFRPGPQENIPTYIARKNGEDKNFQVDLKLQPILNVTYGIIVYQEQVMMLLQTVANFSLSKADIVRRSMGKKDAQLMHKFQEEFLVGAKQNGYDTKQATELWHYIEKFAEYGFNKSHAIAYSLIGYWMAYLKTNYKPEFYCALLNGVLGNEVRTAQYLGELKNLGYQINGPNIKNPNNVYYFSNNMINIPLNVVKNIGPEFIKILQKIFRADKESLQSLIRILAKLTNNGLTEQRYSSLVFAGAFDSYGYSRRSLMAYKDLILNLAEVCAVEGFENLELDLPNNLPDRLEINADYEKEYLGFYLSAHPVALVRKSLTKGENLFYLANLTKKDLVCDILVRIDNIVTKTDKNGKKMCFLDVSDDTGTMSVTIFASLYEKVKSSIELSKYLILRVKTQNYNEKITCLLDSVKKVIK